MYNLKKRFFLMIILIVVFVLLPTTGVCAKNYEWKCIVPSLNSPSTKNLRIIAKKIESATNGQLKVDIFLPGEHPYKLGEQLKAISTGEVQMGGIIAGYVSGVEPSFMAVDLPLLIPAGDFAVYRNLIKRLMDGPYKAIFDKWGVHEVLYSVTPSQNYYLTEGWIENFDSLKGKKIRSWSKEVSNLIVLMGGIPVTLAYQDVPSALQTGLLDGTTTSFSGAYDGKVFEKCKNIVMLQASYSEQMYIVNNKAWNELPSGIQKIVQDIFDSEQESFELAEYSPVALAFDGAFANYNVEIRGVPKEFRAALLNKAYEAIWKPWLDVAGEEGLKAFNMVVKELEDMGYKIPIPPEK